MNNHLAEKIKNAVTNQILTEGDLAVSIMDAAVAAKIVCCITEELTLTVTIKVSKD